MAEATVRLSARMAAEWIAHRGAPRPGVAENTIAAFVAAAAAGAVGVELDVRGTRDGQLAVFHDARARGSRVRHLTLAELRRATGVAVPTLDEALAALPRAVGVIVEIKDPGLERAIAAAVAGPARRLAWLRVASFGPRVLRRMRRLAPDVDRALCLWAGKGPRGARRAAQPIAAMSAGFARDLMLHHPLVTPELVADVRARGGEVWPWTVNAPSDAARMTACAVRWLITDVSGGFP